MLPPEAWGVPQSLFRTFPRVLKMKHPFWILQNTLWHVQYKFGSCPLCFYFAPVLSHKPTGPGDVGGGWYQHGESTPLKWVMVVNCTPHLPWATVSFSASCTWRCLETPCADMDQNRNSWGGSKPRELMVQWCLCHYCGSSLPMCVCSSLSLSSFLSVNLFHPHQYSCQKCGTGITSSFFSEENELQKDQGVFSLKNE